MDDNKLPKEIYAWNYRGSFNTGLGLPVADMGDTPWAVYTRAQPKYKRVDLETLYKNTCNCEGDGGPCMSCAHDFGWNEAIDEIKSKYGELYVLTKEGE